MSDTMEEGVIASWLKKVGDKIKSGDILAEVETDKATMELESYWDGELLHIGVKESEAVPVNNIIAIIGKKGEDISGLLQEGNSSGENTTEQISNASSAPSTSVGNKSKVEKIDVSGINATVVQMPKMSDTMLEGTIASWMKKVGDSVKSGDVLAEIETDKATMEFESYWEGTLLYIGPKAGDSVPVDAVLAVIGEKGADFETLLKAHQSGSDEGPNEQETEKSAEISQTQSNKNKEVVQTIASDSGRIKASPLAKKIASELGYDISKIKGSGDHGRIVKRDVENYKPEVQQATSATSPSQSAIKLPVVTGEERYTDVPLSQMRKTIAKRLSESKFSAPHFYLTMEINMDNAIEARKSMNEISPVKISFNDIIIKAVSVALTKNPDVNVSWLGDKIRKNEHVNIGVAVAIPDGLIVPVVRFANTKTISHISAEVKDLAQKAANKQLQPEDWEGSTFTISNLGMFGIEEFTAIINPPDACILAVGGIKETPIVKNGNIVPGNVMKVTLSCDHRAVDGAVGSAFLKTLKELMENPVRILV